MRSDTPPREPDEGIDGIDDIVANGILVDDGEDFGAEDDLDELEEIELEELERRLNAGRNQDSDTDEENETDAHMRATPEDKSMMTFAEHASPVFSCDLHPELDLAVTGGQDDTAVIWDTQTGQVLYRILNHTDTVTATKFSHDGNYVFSADMAGNIFVYKILARVATPGTELAPSAATATNTATPGNGNAAQSDDSKPKITVEKVWEYAMGDMSWCFWHDRANVLFAGSADTGEIYMWRIPSGDCKVFAGPGCPGGAADLTDDGKKLFASYNDGSLRLWDLRSGNAILTINDEHSNEVVAAIACDRNGSLYASGDVDGKILFCTQSGPVHSVRTKGMVECLAFSPSTELKLLASASLEGETTIWDYGHFAKRLECVQPDDNQVGVCGMKWLTAYSLAIGTVEGDILIYDARSGILKCQLTGHRAHIYDFCYNRRNNTILSASEDGKSKIFAVPNLED